MLHSVTVLFHCAFFACTFGVFLSGIYVYFSNKEDNKCKMTYMYEMPEYIPVRLPREVKKSFPSYNLYAYGEGSYANQLYSGKFNGIPVLFLPGNSGSYKQVRSLASVSLTKAAKNRHPFHFNYFTADFNDELSALYGGFLETQTEFASACIDAILRLYENHPVPPDSVIIVGHSMGGLIAKAMFTLPHFNTNKIKVIVTKATPNMSPVFIPDMYMMAFYNRVNEFWAKNRNFSLNHVNLVSINGGRRDKMVRPDITQQNPQSVSANDICVMSNSIPNVWVGTDHLCIVWCNQLVLVIVRSFFEMVDRSTKLLISDHNLRRDILEKHFIRHGKARSLSLPQEWGVPFTFRKLWTSQHKGTWGFQSDSKNSGNPSALLLSVKPGNDLIVTSYHVNLEPWIFACVPELERDQCIITNNTPSYCQRVYTPSSVGLFKNFYCSSTNETGHFVIKLPTDDSIKVAIFAQLFEASTRRWEVLWNFSGFRVIVPEGSLYATVKLPYLINVWQAYKADVFVSGDNCPVSQAGAIHQIVPWSKEDTFTVLNQKKVTHTIMLFNAQPDNYKGKIPELKFYLHPNCSLEITVSYSMEDALEQLARYYMPFCPTFLTVSFLLLTTSQLFYPAQSPNLRVKAITVIPPSIIYGLYYLGYHHDHRCRSFLTLIIVQFACDYFVRIIFISTKIVTTLFLKLLVRLFIFKRLQSRNRIVSYSIVDFIICFLLLCISYFTCGAFVILIVQVVMIIKLMYKQFQQYIQYKGNFWQENMYITFYLLLVSMSMFTGHCLIIWAINLKFGRLSPDPTFLPSVIMIPCVIHSGYFIKLLTKQHSYKGTWHIGSLLNCQLVFISIALIFGLENVFMLSWVVAVDILILSYLPSFISLHDFQH